VLRSPPHHQPHEAIVQAEADRTRLAWRPGTRAGSNRLPPVSRPQSRAGRRLTVGGDGDGRAQDGIDLSEVRDRGRGRAAGRGGQDRSRRGHRHTDGQCTPNGHSEARMIREFTNADYPSHGTAERVLNALGSRLTRSGLHEQSSTNRSPYIRDLFVIRRAAHRMGSDRLRSRTRTRDCRTQPEAHVDAQRGPLDSAGQPRDDTNQATTVQRPRFASITNV
jgi:hypothetical protein